MSQALAVTQDQVGEAIAQVRGERTLAQIQSVLPDNVPVARFVRAAVTAITENPDLVTVDRDSLFLGLVKCAQDGLLPDGREAALIPFNDRKRGKIATYIPMISGYRKIAGEHGWSIETAVVYAEDEFEHEMGGEPRVIHRRPKLGVERGAMVGAYAIGRHRSFSTQIVVLDAGEVEKVKKTSKALSFGPWKDWEPQMWEKTAGRKLFKQLPLGERDSERIRRMLADHDLGPDALYGRDPRALNASSPDPGEAASPAAALGRGDADGGPQAAAPPSSGAAVPGFDWNSAGGPATDQTAEEGPRSPTPPEAPTDQGSGMGAGTPSPTPAAGYDPGRTLAPEGAYCGQYGGKAISEIAASDEGQAFLLKLLRDVPASDPFRMDVAAHVRIALPDLWEQHEAATS